MRQSVLAVGCHSSMHMCKDDASTAIAWVAPRIKLLKILIKKEQKQVSINSKMKSTPCRDGSMHKSLADKVQSCYLCRDGC